MFKSLISNVVELSGRRTCSIPTKCVTTEDRSFDEIMESQWEELVIRFDNNANDYVFKTACCPGAPAC